MKAHRTAESTRGRAPAKAPAKAIRNPFPASLARLEGACSKPLWELLGVTPRAVQLWKAGAAPGGMAEAFVRVLHLVKGTVDLGALAEGELMLLPDPWAEAPAPEVDLEAERERIRAELLPAIRAEVEREIRARDAAEAAELQAAEPEDEPARPAPAPAPTAMESKKAEAAPPAGPELRIRNRGDRQVETVPAARAARLIDSGAADPHEDWTAEDLAAYEAAHRAREGAARAVLERDGLLPPYARTPEDLGPMGRLRYRYGG